MASADFASFSVPLLSTIVGGVLILLFFADYFRRKRAEISTIAAAQSPQQPDATKPPPSSSSSVASKKTHRQRPHSHSATDKDQNRKHHHLDVNTLKGHSDTVTAICFSSDGHSLATGEFVRFVSVPPLIRETYLWFLARKPDAHDSRFLTAACADGAIRVFRLDDASSKSFNWGSSDSHCILRGVFFVGRGSSDALGSSLFMYGDVGAKPSAEGKQQAKLPLPEIKWEHQKIHDQGSVLNLSAVPATYGTADGSIIIASCSEGTSIKLWHGKSGKELGTVDTNQLKNNMATLSPNGRFLAAAAFTADVKVWEIVYSKDGSVKEVLKVMQLKGHKSAVTCLCFTHNSEQIITASKDGSLRVWNINVRYHLDEDPKTLKVLPIPLHDSKGAVSNYNHISISPDGKILATISGSTLQWLCAGTGSVLDTADKAHEGDVTGIAWAPQSIPVGGARAMVLATAGANKKVKLWLAPESNPSR
ncbi:WD domain, G-beta repeat [Musa troglodytarum]|uniref:WD domain, G-beta repeat n=1 Tax=Musa troglodytarum TaxID=320322 RepID=A0A9E7L225_9LILI|nr:WD domain, G-beta repeat [Musa troglodytarum]